MNVKKIIQASESALELVSKTTKRLEPLGKQARKAAGISRGAVVCEEIIAGGKTVIGDVFEKTLRFKGEDGKTLQKIIDRTEGGNSFRTVKNYHRNQNFNSIEEVDNGKSLFTFTKEFKNGQLTSSTQETITTVDSLRDKTRKVVTRTNVKRNYLGNGEASLDTHSISQFSNDSTKGRNKKLELNFTRNEDGLISSDIEAKNTLCSFNPSEDPYLPVYLNTDKSKVARDLVAIQAKRAGFEKVPEIGVYRKKSRSMGSMSSYTLNESGIKLIYPKIDIHAGQVKSELVNTAAHEVRHMTQDGCLMDKDALSEMDNNIRKFWEGSKIVKSGLPNNPNNSVGMAYTNASLENIKNRTLYPLDYAKYKNNLLEVGAQHKGDKAEKFFNGKLMKVCINFPTADWSRLMA